MAAVLALQEMADKAAPLLGIDPSLSLTQKVAKANGYFPRRRSGFVFSPRTRSDPRAAGRGTERGSSSGGATPKERVRNEPWVKRGAERSICARSVSQLIA